MVIASHSVIGMYGFWLPNDGRGSGSDFVGAKHLLPYGLATKVHDRRRSRARVPHDRVARIEAKRALLYDPVILTLEQIHSVARGFASVVRRTGCVLYACSILPDHTHLVPARHSYPIERLITLLKGGASEQLRRDGLHPFQDQMNPYGTLPKAFQRDGWNVFLNTPQEVIDRIAYAKQNLIDRGMEPQDWEFVTPFDHAEWS